MITYNEAIKDLYKEFILRGCLIIVDKYEDEFRGTGKTQALKELEQDNYKIVLGGSATKEYIEFLKKDIKRKLNKFEEVNGVRVLIDEDANIHRNMNIGTVRVEIAGGFAYKNKIDDIIPLLVKGTKIIDTTSNRSLLTILPDDITAMFYRKLNAIKQFELGVISKSFRDSILNAVEKSKLTYDELLEIEIQAKKEFSKKMNEDNNNLIITNDSVSHTFINLVIDNSEITHKKLDKFIEELHELGKKYSLVNLKEGVLHD